MNINTILSDWLDNTTAVKTDRKSVDISGYGLVHQDDWEPVSAIKPSAEGPWICGGAPLMWYQGHPVGDSDIDVFCSDKLQKNTIHDRLLEFGARITHQTENATTFEYSAQSEYAPRQWKLQLIHREYYDTIEDVINSFDISVTMLGTDGHQFFYGSRTIQDISTRTLRMSIPLRAGALKRYCKYVAYGYRPVVGLHEMIVENPDTTWEFAFTDDYDDIQPI